MNEDQKAVSAVRLAFDALNEAMSKAAQRDLKVDMKVLSTDCSTIGSPWRKYTTSLVDLSIMKHMG